MDWISVFSNVGFPVAVAVAMFWYTQNVTDKLRETLERNTQALLVLSERLDHEQKNEAVRLTKADEKSE